MKSSRYFYLLVPVFLLVGWVISYYAWRARGGSENLRPLFDTSKQWYIGRDGEVDAKDDIRRGRMKLFGGWSGSDLDSYELESYQRILREHYAVEPVSLYEGDAIPNKYVVPYCNAYNAVIFEHLKATHGPDIAKRIRSEYQKEAELKRKADEVLNQPPEVNANTTTTDQRLVLPEEYLGGAENLKALSKAAILTVEKVSVPPELKLKGIKDGRPDFEEQPVLRWTGGSLQIDKGPVAIPAALAIRIKAVLSEKWIDDGSAIANNNYRPIYRIKLNDPGHAMEILVIDGFGSFALYRDGMCVGGRPPGQNEQEFRKIIAELEALLSQ